MAQRTKARPMRAHGSPQGPAPLGPGGHTMAQPTRAQPIRAQGGPQGRSPQGPGEPTRARPTRAWGITRARFTRAQGSPQGSGTQRPRGAHKGPAHEGPVRPIRVWTMRAQGSGGDYKGLAQKGPEVRQKIKSIIKCYPSYIAYIYDLHLSIYI